MSKSTCSETDSKSKSILSGALDSAFETTLEKFSSSIKFSSFKKKYRAIYEIDPDGLKSYYDQLKMQLRQNAREDLKNCSTNLGIVNLLDSLEKINENKNAISWRPTGNPEEDVRDHIYALKVQHKDRLESYLSSLQVENEKIHTEAAVNHAKILHLKETNKKLYVKFNTIIDLYTGSNFHDFQAKAAECFIELKSQRVMAKRKNIESPEIAKKSRFDTHAHIK